MKKPIFPLVVVAALVLSGCGGGDSKSPSSTKTESTNVPISVSIQDVELTAGNPVGFVYTIPATEKTYTDVKIDLTKMLETATIEATPR